MGIRYMKESRSFLVTNWVIKNLEVGFGIIVFPDIKLVYLGSKRTDCNQKLLF